MTTKQQSQITLSHLGTNPSKQQEIDFLSLIVSNLPADSYLAGLFTPNFIGEVNRRIRDDWSMDVYGDLQYAQDNAQAAAKKDHDYLSGELHKAAASIERRDNEIEALKRSNEIQAAGYAQAVKDRTQLGQMISEVQEDRNQLEQENEILKGKIIELKAMIFDLEHQGK